MPQPQDQDLFESSTMTFGEHLEELRACLIKAILWLVIGTLFGLIVGKYVVNTIKSPLEGSLKVYYTKDATNKFKEFETQRKADGQTVPYTLPQIERLVGIEGMLFEIEYVYPPEMFGEINRRYPGLFEDDRIPSEPPTALPKDVKERETDADPDQPDKVVTPYLYREDLVPVFMWHRTLDDPRITVSSLASQEAFMIWLKGSIVAGIIFSSPMVFYHLWTFVAAGLYPHEKKYVHIYMPFSILLFLAGAAFCFIWVVPVVLNFLFEFNETLGIRPDPRISEWLSFALFLPVGFGISFQLPLVMLFLQRVGIMSIEVYLAKWRIAVLTICVIAMLLTPADPMSMLMMAVPLTILYFGGIGLCKWLPKTNSPLDA